MLSNTSKNYKQKNWIDRKTAVIHLYFTVYNPAIDLFGTIDYEFKFLEAGGVKVTLDNRVINLQRHLMIMTKVRDLFPPTSSDWVILFVEFIFYVLVLTYIVVEGKNMWKQGRKKYFGNPWGVMDGMNMIIFCIMITLRFVTMVTMAKLEYNPQAGEYQNFIEAAWVMYQVNNWTSFNCVLCWIKLFKFLKISPQMNQLVETIRLSTQDLFGFTILFTIVFMSYAQSFYLAFGMDLEEFSNIMSSVFTLLKMMMGDMDLGAIRAANKYLGPLLFLSFVFIIFFILMNMFLAIVGEAHEAAKEEAEGQEDPFLAQLKLGILGPLKKLFFNKEFRDNFFKDDEEQKVVEEVEEVEHLPDLEEVKQVLYELTLKEVYTNPYKLAPLIQELQVCHRALHLIVTDHNLAPEEAQKFHDAWFEVDTQLHKFTRKEMFMGAIESKQARTLGFEQTYKPLELQIGGGISQLSEAQEKALQDMTAYQDMIVHKLMCLTSTLTAIHAKVLNDKR